jgi:hypothetical protein
MLDEDEGDDDESVPRVRPPSFRTHIASVIERHPEISNNRRRDLMTDWCPTGNPFTDQAEEEDDKDERGKGQDDASPGLTNVNKTAETEEKTTVGVETIAFINVLLQQCLAEIVSVICEQVSAIGSSQALRLGSIVAASRTKIAQNDPSIGHEMEDFIEVCTQQPERAMPMDGEFLDNCRILHNLLRAETQLPDDKVTAAACKTLVRVLEFMTLKLLELLCKCCENPDYVMDGEAIAADGSQTKDAAIAATFGRFFLENKGARKGYLWLLKAVQRNVMVHR